MNLIFRCEDCAKRLELHEVQTIPGQEIVDPSGLRWGTGKRLCLGCYKNNTTKSVEVYEEKVTRISELEVGSNYSKIKVRIIKKISEEKKSKYGKELILGKFGVKDDSGEIILTLWSDDLNRIKEGDVLIIENGYVRDFMNEKYLTLGKKGRLTILK